MLSINSNTKLKNVIYLLLTIVFLIPNFLQYSNDLYLLFLLWRYIQVGVMTLLVIHYFVSKKHNIIISLIIAMYFWIAFSCFYHGKDMFSFIWSFAPDLGLSLIALKGINDLKEKYINQLMKIFFMYIIINEISIIAFPNGLAQGRLGQIVWFLGNKNSFTPYILISVILIIIDSKIKYRKITASAFIKCAVVLSNSLLVDSATTKLLSFLVAIVLLIEMIVVSYKVKRIFIGRKRLFFIFIIVFLYIILLNRNGTFSVFINQMIGRDLTFSSRIFLWEIAIEYITKNPVFGMGPDVVYFPSNFTEPMTHAHNLYLNIAAKYGLPALVLFLVIIIWIYLVNNKKIKSRDNILLSVYVILTLYLIASIVEVYLLHYLFMVFIILSSFVESGGFQKNAKEDK